MQRILLIVVVLMVIWRIASAVGRRLSEKAPNADSFSRFSPEARRRRKQWPGGNEAGVEELVECSRCGTFVPAGRALPRAGGGSFCSEECQRQVADGQ